MINYLICDNFNIGTVMLELLLVIGIIFIGSIPKLKIITCKTFLYPFAFIVSMMMNINDYLKQKNFDDF